MVKLVRMARFWLAVILVVAALGIPPCHATVAGDVAAGLPLGKVIDNGLKAGLALNTILVQAMDAGVEPCPIMKAALARGLDLITVLRLLSDYCASTLTGPRKNEPQWCEACTTCGLMKCAIKTVRDPVEVANAMMAIGADLSEVRQCLGGMGVTYTYTPPPVVPSGVAPSFPGNPPVASPSS